ncbi:hypothetical protein K2Y11_19370 [bacterium]|nr:hypothetical protein [bacterium]
MAVRRSSEVDGGLDALLDTLTDVIGTLVILLAIMQIDVTRSIQRVQGIDPDATETNLAKLSTKVDQANQELIKLRELSDKTNRAPDDLKKVKDQIAVLREEVAAPLPKVRTPEEVTKELEEIKRKADEADKTFASLEQTVADLRARISEIKPLKEPPPKIVQLPNPRGAPDGLKQAIFVCKGDRVSYIDVDATVNYAVDTIRKRGLTSGSTCNCDKAVNLFENEKLGNEDFRLKLRDINKIPHLVIEHIDGKGSMIRQLKRPTSEFGQAIGQLNPQTHYARFLVWTDSYDAYLAARKICDEMGIAAGWQPFDEKGEWIISLGGQLQCEGYVPPPPPKEPPKPVKPRPVDTVD